MDCLSMFRGFFLSVFSLGKCPLIENSVHFSYIKANSPCCDYSIMDILSMINFGLFGAIFKNKDMFIMVVWDS